MSVRSRTARFKPLFERRIVPRAGHNLPQEAPEAFAKAVLDLSRKILKPCASQESGAKNCRRVWDFVDGIISTQEKESRCLNQTRMLLTKCRGPIRSRLTMTGTR
ncbi:alpha/beta hydrolase [Mesorhizobium sp. M2A.F.Ca.ET.037.01.1.1]|nr:alpha/beta hydrolase [Mesorhizobium sp. M2A.F.Ca.ET.037.01.1.1]